MNILIANILIVLLAFVAAAALGVLCIWLLLTRLAPRMASLKTPAGRAAARRLPDEADDPTSFGFGISPPAGPLEMAVFTALATPIFPIALVFFWRHRPVQIVGTPSGLWIVRRKIGRALVNPVNVEGSRRVRFGSCVDIGASEIWLWPGHAEALGIDQMARSRPSQ